MKIHGSIFSLEEFHTMIDNVSMRRAYSIGNGIPTRQEYYRGQVCSEWAIKPSLVRDLKSTEKVVEIENRIMEFFQTEIKNRNYGDKIFLHEKPIPYQNEWAWLSQAQHYGIPTRLLDWTIKPEVALYFAVENPIYDDKDGQFLIIYTSNSDFKTETHEHPQYFETHPKDVTETWLLNPCFYYVDDENSTAEVRRARQHGKFTLQSVEKSLVGLDEQTELLIPWNKTIDTVIEKYVIPASVKSQIRLDLISKGWHGDYLYVNDDKEINDIRDKCKKILASAKEC